MFLLYLQAHYHSRRAEYHLRARRFDEAAESHQKAAATLEEALQCSTVPKAIESIRLQREFHLKHVELIRLKKQQYEKYKQALEHQRLKNLDLIEQRSTKDRIESACDLQIAIYKTLEDSDCLLETLSKRNLSGSDGKSDASRNMVESKTVSIENVDEIKLDIGKKSKDENAILDELHTLNHQLHILVYSLISRMDETNQDAEALRERAKMLEKERNGQRNGSNNKPVASTENPAGLENSASASAERELNRRCSITGEERKIVLPDSSDLPPLELPEFDFTPFENKD